MKTSRRGLFKLFGAGATVAALPRAPSKADVIEQTKKTYSAKDFTLTFPEDESHRWEIQGVTFFEKDK